MIPLRMAQARQERRTPHGVRGLKLCSGIRRIVINLSHPAWGAWIEIDIEKSVIAFCNGRTPHGVRGLKCDLRNRERKLERVAPRMGCVD